MLRWLLLSRIWMLGFFGPVISHAYPLYIVEGAVQVRIEVAPPDLRDLKFLQNYSVQEMSGYKIISLMKITPSPRIQKNMLLQQSLTPNEKDYSNGITPFNMSPGAVDLGMNNTPVFDQGEYGTCSTFAVTAVFDAFVGKGDYIDQQCSLELDATVSGNYWDGNDSVIQVVAPLLEYGIMKKNTCFGNIYPNRYASSLSLDEYTRASDKTSLKYAHYVYYGNPSIEDVKKALRVGHRVVAASRIGFLTQGFNVKIGKHQYVGGLWACRQPFDTRDFCDSVQGAHAFVVIGFDDNQKLLKIRNSWNVNSGEQGDFYMTYTYFTRMKEEAAEIF